MSEPQTWEQQLHARVLELEAMRYALEREVEEACIPLGQEVHTNNTQCPTWYDYCRCSVATLRYQINRARELEEARDQLRTTCDELRAEMGAMAMERNEARAIACVLAGWVTGEWTTAMNKTYEWAATLPRE